MRFLFPLALMMAVSLASEVDLDRVLFVVNSQPNAHHAQVAKETKANVLDSMRKAGAKNPRVLLTHEDMNNHGAWAYFPLMESLGADYATKIDWVVFLQENTEVRPEILKDVLRDRSPDEPVFLGHGLKDSSHVIIHHYDQPDLEFPLLGAGFVLSMPLVINLKDRLEDFSDQRTKFPRDFSIDAPYELAKVIFHLNDRWDEEAEPPEELDTLEPGLRLTHDSRLCAKEGPKCATFPRAKTCPLSKDDSIVLAKKTLFAIKTCQKFHKDRLPVIKSTWDNAAINIEYFSEVADPKYGTRTLPGVKNTERGHCKKTVSIIEYFNENATENGWEWLVIADDDTMLGVHKMLELLNCYDHGDFVALGQRYGFRIANGRHGYDYPTGGGGMIFSKAAAKKMMERNACKCNSDDSPDDMHLGGCMASIGQTMVHTTRLHQAREDDYPITLLEEHDPVSFHKFWNNDPKKTYDTWFKKADAELKEYKFNLKNPHQDL